MEEEDKYIEILMENVSRDLDKITHKLDHLESNKSHLKETELIESISKSQREIRADIITSENSLKKIINEKKPIINQHYRAEYVMFGKDSPFSSKLLLALICTILISIPIFKYIPPYIIEKSDLKKERDDYKLFHNFVLLKAFEKSDKNYGDFSEIMERIRDRDTTYMRYIQDLSDTYNNHLRKEKLKAELKELE